MKFYLCLLFLVLVASSLVSCHAESFHSNELMNPNKEMLNTDEETGEKQ